MNNDKIRETFYQIKQMCKYQLGLDPAPAFLGYNKGMAMRVTFDHADLLITSFEDGVYHIDMRLI